MVTTLRTGIPLRLLAVSVACLVVLLTSAAVGIPQARAADGPSCATAAVLVTRGLPRQALALLATPGSPSCPDAASAATTAIAQSVGLAQEAAESVGDEKWEDARGTATAALRLDRDNAAADRLRTQALLEVEKAKAGAAAKAETGKSWLEKLQDQWNGFFDHQLSPAGALLLPFLGSLLGLVVLARLVVLAVRRWPPADDLPAIGQQPNDVIRPTILIGGMFSVVAASLLASVVAADSVSHPLSTTLTWVTLVLTLLAAWLGIRTARRLGKRATQAKEQTTPLQPVPGGPAQHPHPWALRTRSVIAALSIIAGVLSVAAAATRLEGGDEIPDAPEPLAVLGLASVLAIQGVWLLAWWLATRIRLDVKGPTGAAEVGTVAAVLYELGAAKPQGLEVPRGADVTALDGALGSLPDNPVLKVLKDIIRSISGVTPWTATIEGDATARVVTVVRNGRTLGSAILDPQRLGLGEQRSSAADESSATTKTVSSTAKAASPATADRTLQMAAAFVLSTMAKQHPVIARGLAGATSWKSLGYQYLGSTTQPGASDTAGQEQKRALLARALDEDGGNRAARLSFRHAIDRDTTDCQALDRYAKFLDEFCIDLDGHVDDFDTTALKLRATYTRAIVLVNAVYAHEKDEHDTQGGEPCELKVKTLERQAQKALGSLLELAVIKHGASSPDPLEEFKAQFTDDIKGTLLLARLSPMTPTPSSPIGMYNLGCTFASRHDIPWQPPESATPEEREATELTTAITADDLTALMWLQLASQDPHTKEWMPDDPQLTKFRTRPTYRNNFLTTPRDDFFTLSTVTPYASQLKTAGYGDVSLLSSADPMALGVVLSAAPGVRAQLVELAQLHGGLQSIDGARKARAFVRLLEAFEGPPTPEPERLRWWIELGEIVRAYLDESSTPSDEENALLNRWAIEILDELSKSGLARREALVTLPADRQLARAQKIAATLMKRHQPGNRQGTGGDLDAYERRLADTITTWFQQPY